MSGLYQTIIILSTIGLIFPCFAFAEPPIKAPDTLEDAKSFAINIITAMPEGIKGAWEEAKEIWQKTWVSWWKNWGKGHWQGIENRGPMIKEEFQKEKQEMKEEIEKETRSIEKNIWERFKELIKKSL